MSTLRRRLTHPLILAAFVFTYCVPADPTPRGGGQVFIALSHARSYVITDRDARRRRNYKKYLRACGGDKSDPSAVGERSRSRAFPANPTLITSARVAGGSLENGRRRCRTGRPLFDKEDISSIGAIAVARFRP